MIKFVKLGLYYTALGVLVYFITPELFHIITREFSEAGTNIMSGIKAEIGRYIKEQAVEGVKDIFKTDPNFNKGR